MKHYYYISELCEGTVVQSDGEYGIVRKHLKKPYYAYLGFKPEVLLYDFKDKEIENAVNVLDFEVDEDE